MTSPPLVKQRQSTMDLVSRIVPPKFQSYLAKGYKFLTPWIGYWIGMVVLFLVFVDAIANNWAINDFCGNGMQFRTPVAHIETMSDLTSQYSFAHGKSLNDLSHIGLYMTTFSTQDLATNAQDVFLLTAGSYNVVGENMNMCRDFLGTYPIDWNKPIKLAAVIDGVTFLRGDAVSHVFTNDLIDNLPNSKSTMADLDQMGFKGARIQVDLRFLMNLPLLNTSIPQIFITKWYRIYSKSYCTGCPPIAELGRGVCNLTGIYMDNITSFRITKTQAVVDSIHDVGIMFRRDIYSTIGAILRYIAIFIAVAGYLASRKTVQWQEENVEKVETVWIKIVQMISPKYFPHLSHALRFDIFCYNSDIFVLLFVSANLMDMNHALVYIRESNVQNQKSSQFGMSLQLFALSTRLLWINVGFVKLAKAFLHVISPAAYCGENILMRYLNFSSVTTLYLSAILLFYVPDYIEYNNKSRWDVFNSKEKLDGHFVDFFNSFYIRGVLSIAIGLITNVLSVLLFDHIILFKLWKKYCNNSLTRQAIYNSTAAICEFVGDVENENKNSIIHCKARRLCTLQWYFMNHMICFALPEKDMSKKKNYTASVPTTEKGDGIETKDGVYIVGQSDNGHFHLFDERLVDVKSLPLNIKVLRNTFINIK